MKARLEQRGVIIADTPTENQHGAVVMQPMTYIDEANLYRCIFQSRKAEAEKFQSWVFEEVLPQIRRTGDYIPTKDSEGRLLTEEQIVEQAMGILGRTLGAELPEQLVRQASAIARKVLREIILVEK